MDLNQKYADHQTAMIRASAARSVALRDGHLEIAALIARQIECFQLKLGAAASCAWSATRLGSQSFLESKDEGTL